MNRRAAVRVLSLTAIGQLGCKASFPFSPTGSTGSRIGLQLHYNLATRAEQSPGERVQLRAFTIDVEEIFTDVSRSATWTSSDPEVMRVESAGVFQALRLGLAEVTAIYEGTSSSILIEVTPPRRLPYLDLVTLGALVVGNSTDWRALMRGLTFGDDVTQAAAWTSSDPSVVTVAGGRLTGVRPGTVEVRATFQDFSTAFRVSVLPQRSAL